ncbi:MAG: MFS transporter [Actinomycetota bacterium]
MTAAGTVTGGLLGPELRPLTVSLMSSITLVAYNNLAVTAALPDIGNDLGSVDLLPSVVTVELLASAIAVLAIGPLVDSIGVRVVYRVSMVGFVAASILCAVAPAMLVLVGARVAQGLAAGGVIGSTLSSIGLAFEPAMRPRMYAAISAVWGVLGVAGPAVAAVLISVLGWRWVFLVIVPIGIPAMLIGWSRLPGRRTTAGAADPAETVTSRFDGVGLAVVTVVTVCLLIGASTPSLVAIAYLAAGAIGFVAYLAHARRVADPVVRLEHLTGARWRNIHLTSTLAVGGGTGASAFLPVYLTGARGFSTGAAAFSVLYMVIGWSLAAAVASRLLDHRQPPPVITLGTTLLAAGCVGATLAAGAETPTAVLFACFVVLGAGIGLVTTAGLALLQSRARAEEMGRASSAHQFLRSLGFAYGAALAGLVLFWVIGRRIDDVEAIRGLLGDDGAAALSTEARDALQAGYVAALGVMAVVASGTVVSAWRLRRERPVDPDPTSNPTPDPDPTPDPTPTPGG